MDIETSARNLGFEAKIVAKKLARINVLLPSVDDFIIQNSSKKHPQKYPEISIKNRYDFVDSVTGICTNISTSCERHKLEISKNRANYFLQELIYRDK